MIDLSQMRDHPVIAPHVRWVNDLGALYSRTKAAQAQAEQHGFVGTAAALADIAATLAWELGVDPTTARTLTGSSAASPAGAPSSHESHAYPATRH